MNGTHSRHTIIDTYLLYWGRAQRKDLMRHLGIGSVTATRIFNEYSKLNPGALLINPSKKAYVYTAGFKPLEWPSPESVLPLLAYGIEQTQRAAICYGPASPRVVTAALCAKKVSAITRAMVSGVGVAMSYISGTSGVSTRHVYPHAVFMSGGVWYFRGYDDKSRSFRTFRFSRVELVGEEELLPEYLKTLVDEDWNSSATLTVAPHSRHPQKDALAMDLGLQDRPVSNIDVNRAIAGFVLTDLRVDCSINASLNPFEYHLQLMNRHELGDIDSLKIAPGYSAES